MIYFKLVINIPATKPLTVRCALKKCQKTVIFARFSRDFSTFDLEKQPRCTQKTTPCFSMN